VLAEESTPRTAERRATISSFAKVMAARKKRPAYPIPKADAALLRWAAASGEKYVVLDGVDDRRISVETESMTRALFQAEIAGDCNPTIYERATRGWRMVKS
jgi:hypothetical protein